MRSGVGRERGEEPPRPLRRVGDPRLVAGLPAFVLALIVFFSGTVRLLERREASTSALFFAATTVVTGLAMHLVLWNLWLGRAYPHYFAHGRRLHRRRKIPRS